MCCVVTCCLFFFCKQKTAYEMRISDWSSDVCSSDLHPCAEIEQGCDEVERPAERDPAKLARQGAFRPQQSRRGRQSAIGRRRQPLRIERGGQDRKSGV